MPVLQLKAPRMMQCSQHRLVVSVDRALATCLLCTFSLTPVILPAAMCRAHGIAHQAVRTPEELPWALESAWRLNRHSVVEVPFRLKSLPPSHGDVAVE